MIRQIEKRVFTNFITNSGWMEIAYTKEALSGDDVIYYVTPAGNVVSAMRHEDTYRITYPYPPGISAG